MKILLYSLLTLWGSFLAMHGYYFLSDLSGALHPSWVPLACFLAVQVLSLLVLLCGGLWRMLRGPRRLKAFALVLWGLLPGFIWYSQVSITYEILQLTRTQHVDFHWYCLTAGPIGAAVLDAKVAMLPHRLDGRKVRMFYDDSIADPQRDLEMMEQFIAKEEKFLGVEMPDTMHWVRASLFGEDGFAMNGMAVARPDPQQESIGMGFADYHEASHVIISNRFSFDEYRGRHPSVLMIEGWAQARSCTWGQLASECLYLLEYGEPLSLRELISPDLYYRPELRVYLHGGPLVYVLLQKCGPEKFYEFYTTTTQDTFEQDFQRIFGLSLEQAEEMYLAEVRGKNVFEKNIASLAEEEKILLREFRDAYERQCAAYLKLLGHADVTSQTKSSYSHLAWNTQENPLEEIGRLRPYFQVKMNYHGRDKTRFLYHNEVNLYEEEGDSETQQDALPDKFYSDFWFFSTPQVRYYCGRNAVEDTAKIEVDFKVLPISEKTTAEWARHCMQTVMPYSLFEFNPAETKFSLNEDVRAYLFRPDIYDSPLRIKSVTLKDDIAEIVLQSEEPKETLTLTADRSRDWILLQANRVRLNEDGQKTTTRDTREYEGEFEGVPLLKSRMTREDVRTLPPSPHFYPHVSEEQTSFEYRLSGFDPQADAKLFDVKEQPFFERLEKTQQTEREAGATPKSPERRISRDLYAITVWALLPIFVLYFGRERREEDSPANAPAQSEPRP